MKKIVVLGGGRVGGPIAYDLANDPDKRVEVVDRDDDVLSKFSGHEKIAVKKADLGDNKLFGPLVRDADYVVSAVPGFMGFRTLEQLIHERKNVIDIAFFPEDLFDLDGMARKNGVTVISDIGVAPGMSNILIGHAYHELDTLSKAITYVGGLPKKRTWPFEYKAGFSPIDVIEEYTRPARYIENGREVIKPALSDPEYIDFENIGTLEAFNSDGLRSLAKTIKADFMIEKTLRYPGHIEIMKVLRHTGFFSKEKLTIKGKEIAPIDVTAKLLFPHWKFDEHEEDLTIMKIIVEGTKGSEKIRFTWDLLDSYDRNTGIHSMARTTGYTATMALRMLDSGLYHHTGVSAPEFIGRDKKCVDFILEGLRARNIFYKHKKEIIS